MSRPSYELTLGQATQCGHTDVAHADESSGTTTGSGPTVVVNTGGKVDHEQLALELLSGETVAYNICGLGRRASASCRALPRPTGCC